MCLTGTETKEDTRTYGNYAAILLQIVWKRVSIIIKARVDHSGASNVSNNLPVRILGELVLARKWVYSSNAHVVVLVKPLLIDVQCFLTIGSRVVSAVRD